MTLGEFKNLTKDISDDVEIIMTNRGGDWSPVIHGEFDFDEDRFELLIDEE